MDSEATDPAVTPDDARAVACPQCGAEPGTPCLVVADKLLYHHRRFYAAEYAVAAARVDREARERAGGAS